MEYRIEAGSALRMYVRAWNVCTIVLVTYVQNDDGSTSVYTTQLTATGNLTRDASPLSRSVEKSGRIVGVGMLTDTTLYYGDAYVTAFVVSGGSDVTQYLGDFYHRDHTPTVGVMNEWDAALGFFKSWPDQVNYNPILDRARSLQVFSKPWWDHSPSGRYLIKDDFEDYSAIGTNWAVTGTGTPALTLNTTLGHSGVKSLNLATRTSGATAGDTATVYKYFQLPADLEGIRFGLWFNSTVSNIRGLTAVLTVYSQALAKTLKAGLYWHKQEATVAVDKLKYLDSAGAWIDAFTDYTITPKATQWDIFEGQLYWEAGVQESFTYDSARLGDRMYNFPTPPAGQDLAAVPTQSCAALEIQVITDTAASANINLDDIVVADLTPNFD